MVTKKNQAEFHSAVSFTYQLNFDPQRARYGTELVILEGSTEIPDNTLSNLS